MTAALLTMQTGEYYFEVKTRSEKNKKSRKSEEVAWPQDQISQHCQELPIQSQSDRPTNSRFPLEG